MDAHLAELIAEGGIDWIFDVFLDGEPRARVFGPAFKRNWVMWRLSKYCIALGTQGLVSVKRWNNGKWEIADDWRQFAN